MNPERVSPAAALAGVLLLLLGGAEVRAQQQGASATVGDSYEELYERFLLEAREAASAQGSANRIAWAAGLARDRRALGRHDLVTVRVVESITAAGSADASLDKSSSASASVTNYFGLEHRFPSWLDPTNLASLGADSDFSGGGSTTRTGELSATITAQIVEVLPNGDFALEGAREIDINGDRQIVVLTGVVRPADVGRNNVVLSPVIGQLRIRYFGQGLIKDNLKPGWLVRLLNKIF